MKLIETLRALPPKQKWLLIGGAAAALVLVVGLILLLTLSGGKQPLSYGIPLYLTEAGKLPRSCSPLNRRSLKACGKAERERRRP